MENDQINSRDLNEDLAVLEVKVDRVKTLFAQYKFGDLQDMQERKQLVDQIHDARRDVIDWSSKIQINLCDGVYTTLTGASKSDDALFEYAEQICSKHTELMFEVSNAIVMDTWMEGMRSVPAVSNACEAMYMDN